MAVKYEIQYNDIVNITHKFELYDDAYVGAIIEVNGRVFLDYADTKNPLEAIQGNGLRVELEADSTMTFSDLYSEEDRAFQVKYYRDSVLKFNGWLNPEGWFESYVIDKWRVSFDCVDGLSFLNDLSYVTPTGLFYVGKQSALEIISNCLFRTGIQQDILIDVAMVYTGLSTSLDVMDNVYFNANRFVKDDGDTIMSCEEVLRSVLEIFTACITTYNGQWMIYKPNQVFSLGNFTAFRYDYLGVELSPTKTATTDISWTLGSDIDGYSPHHASSNQSTTNRKSLGAYRVNYKYGLVNFLVDNSTFVWSVGAIPSWTIDSTTNLVEPANSVGIELTFDATSSVKNLTSDSVALSVDDQITYFIKYKIISGNFDEVPGEFRWGQFFYKVVLVGASTYYLKNDGTWTLTDTTLDSSILGFEVLKTVTKSSNDPLPIAGSIHVEIWTPKQVGISDGVILLSEFNLSPLEEDEDNKVVEGEFHTVERTTKPSANVEDTKEVFVGDNPSGIYVGTIYKTDEATTTSTWNRVGIVEEKPILQIMGEDSLRMQANIGRTFSGGVFGYFEKFSRPAINNRTGNFIVTSYSYDTFNNFITATFTEIFGLELGDIDYEVTYDYGKTVKPTIKG